MQDLETAGYYTNGGGLGEECDGIKLLKGGLGVSASGWWGRLNPMTPRPIPFHYLQPRSMRLRHASLPHVTLAFSLQDNTHSYLVWIVLYRIYKIDFPKNKGI